MSITHEFVVDKKSFAARLFELRERAGISQAEIHRRTNGEIAQSHYSRWERGDVAPSVLFLPLLAKVLGVEVWELLEDPSDTAVAKWKARTRELEKTRKKKASDD